MKKRTDFGGQKTEKKYFKLFWLFLVSFGVLFISYSCTQTENVVYDPSNAKLLVKDDNGVPLAGAVVRFFDDQNAYLACKQQGIESGFISKVITDASGYASFTNLNTDKAYYFFITYRDRVRLTDLDNSSQQYLFSQYLDPGTNSNIEINLQPAKSIVSFYTSPAMASQLPIQIFIQTDSIGYVSQTLTSVPSATNQNGTLSFRLSEGVKRWYARSSKGCLWTDEVTVSGTENFTPILLTDCFAGAVSFYVDSSNSSNLSIDVTLDQNDQIGTLNSYLANTPSACFAPGTITVARDTGNHTYLAQSRRTGCVWSGNVRISQGGCALIKLPKCN